MSALHYDDWQLLAWLDDNAEAVDLAAVSDHIRGCADCRTTAEVLSEFWQQLTEESSYRQVVPANPDPERIAEARSLVERMEAEDTAAQATMRDLRARPVEQWAEYLSAHPSERTEGVVRRLIAEARAYYEQQPRHACDVLTVAAAVANALSSGDALAGELAKERANALRFLGRYQDALKELDQAERLLTRLPVHVFDMAFIDWTRAAVLLHMTRYEEGLEAARRAGRTFRQFGDPARASQVRIIEAGILCEQGDVAGALRIYRELREFFGDTDDVLTRARIEANLAECEMRLGNIAPSRRHAERALAIYAELGNETERLRVEWTLAHCLLRAGKLDAAMTALRSLHRRFQSHGMRGEAAGVLLDIVEVFVARGEWTEARALAAEAAAEFTAMEAPVHIAEAVARLRDSVAAGTATRDFIRHVRSYVAETRWLNSQQT